MQYIFSAFFVEKCTVSEEKRLTLYTHCGIILNGVLCNLKLYYK